MNIAFDFSKRNPKLFQPHDKILSRTDKSLGAVVLVDGGADGGNYLPTDVERQLAPRRLATIIMAQLHRLMDHRLSSGDKIPIGTWLYCIAGVLDMAPRGPYRLGGKTRTFAGLDGETLRTKAYKFGLKVWSDEISKAMAGIAKREKPLGAREIGLRLQVTAAERLALDLRNIKPCDATTEQVEADRRARKLIRDRENDTARRRAAGATPRSESLSATQPWAAEGISRRTWERRRKSQAIGDANDSPTHSTLVLSTLDLRRNCVKSQDAENAKPKTIGNEMTTADELGQSLGGRKMGKSWICKCPNHPDKSASLKIDDGSKVDVLFHCFAGCDPVEIKKELRSRGLLSRDKAKPRANLAKIWNAAKAMYEAGAPISQIVEAHGLSKQAIEERARERNWAFGRSDWPDYDRVPIDLRTENYYAKYG